LLYKEKSQTACGNLPPLCQNKDVALDVFSTTLSAGKRNTYSMTEYHNNTAILVFIRTEADEADAKSFSHSVGQRGNRSLVRQLNRNIIREAKKTLLPTYVLPGQKQVGPSSGARLADGFQRIFKKGFERVIAVGNDCLEVNRSLLLDAEKKLKQAEVVLGPTYDGGTYLIGLSKDSFRKFPLLNLNWETDGLFEELLTYCTHLHAKVSLLKMASDIDDPIDFQKALRQLPFFCRLRRQLENILLRHFLSMSNPHFVPSFFVETSFRLRAPPAVIF